MSGNVASFYRNRLKLRIDRALSSNADYTLSYTPKIGQQSVTVMFNSPFAEYGTGLKQKSYSAKNFGVILLFFLIAYSNCLQAFWVGNAKLFWYQHFTGMMRANEGVLALEIFLIVLSVLLMSALSLIVYFYVMVYLGVRKRKVSQILQVSELVKQERRIAMTAAVVTIALILSSLPSILGGMLQGIYPVFRQRLAMRVADIFLYLNSVANPLIYCYRDRRFKNAVLEILKSRRPKEKPSAVTYAARFRDVKHNDVFGSGKDTLEMQKVENQVRLTRSASCDLTQSVDRAYLDSHKIRLTRSKSSLSLPWQFLRRHILSLSHSVMIGREAFRMSCVLTLIKFVLRSVFPLIETFYPNIIFNLVKPNVQQMSKNAKHLLTIDVRFCQCADLK